MYYVPDGTKECGYYECKKCGNRFLSMQTMKRIPCPDCEAEIDYEIGPDDKRPRSDFSTSLAYSVTPFEPCSDRRRLQLDLVHRFRNNYTTRLSANPIAQV